MSNVKKETLESVMKTVDKTSGGLRLLGHVLIWWGVLIFVVSFSWTMLAYFDVAAKPPKFLSELKDQQVFFFLIGMLFLQLRRAMNAIVMLIKEMEGIV